MHYLELALAIIMELIGTNLMKLSNGFTHLCFSLGTLISYGLCFFFLSLSLKDIKLNIAYATWGGAGIVLAALVLLFLFHEQTSGLQIFGIILIVIGVVITTLADGH